jgi:hypothetical protein
MNTLATGDWTAILSRLNALIFRSDDWKKDLTQEALSTRWCGLPPASESEILEAESRLEVTLPPSYRSFLSISNGWRPLSHFIERLLPVQQINLFRLANPEAAKMIPEYYQNDDFSDEDYLDYETPRHMVALRTHYYPDSILVGRSWGCEDDMILLNPSIVFANGEWEAIFFANWLPGNQRYRSFRDLVMESVNGLERIEEARGTRPTNSK